MKSSEGGHSEKDCSVIDEIVQICIRKAGQAKHCSPKTHALLVERERIRTSLQLRNMTQYQCEIIYGLHPNLTGKM